MQAATKSAAKSSKRSPVNPNTSKTQKAKQPPTASARDDDFIMTLDSDDDVPDQDEDEEMDAIEPESEQEDSQEAEGASNEQDQPLTKNQLKRKQKAHLSNKEKIVESVNSKTNLDGAGTSKGLALSQDFEFDIFGDGSGTLDDDESGKGWDMSVKGHRLNKRLDVDEIIEKRRSKLPQPLSLPQIESSDDQYSDDMQDDEEDDLDQDIRNARFEDSEDDEDEDALDRFGAGASHGKSAPASKPSEEEEDEEMSQDDGDQDPLATDDDDEDDDDEEEDEKPEDAESNSSDDDRDSESETEATKAKKAAFFAEEPITSASKSSTSKDAGAEESSFASFQLSRPILRALTSLSFHKPTPIQSRTIPIALAGKDIVAGAVTGSGKTAAFMIPILERLTWRAKGKMEEARTRVLILAPTRELAIQCYSVGKSLAKFTDIRFCLCVGGLSVKVQEAELKLRPEVVIATPGRLIDHVRNSLSFSLDDIEILVMDEADRMLEDGFSDELNEIVQFCPKEGKRQTMLFSATMTDDVEQLVRLSLKKPIRLFVDPKRSTAKKLIQEFVRVRGSTKGGVAGADGLVGVGADGSEEGGSQSIATSSSGKSEDAHRPALLLALCTRTFTSQVIIFVRSKKLAHQLKIVFGLLGLSAGELHGDLSQEQRIEALTSFRDGKVDFLIATDLASRGLDIKGVSTVINYDMPGQFESYLHRVGRTARAGRQGRSVTLVGEADRKMLKLAIKKASSSDQVKHRIIPPEVSAKMMDVLEELKPEVDAVLREEKEERALRQAEMELKKGENMLLHQEEIYSRPKRTWFQSSKDKKLAEEISKSQYNASMDSKSGKNNGGRDKYAGLSRKKKRNKMLREELEAEKREARSSGGGSGNHLEASVRAAKKAQRPTKLGVPLRTVELGKKKSKLSKSNGSGGKTQSSTQSRNKGKGKPSSFRKDLGERGSRR